MSRTARTYTSVEQWVCAKRANEWVIVVQRQIKKIQLYQGENKLYYMRGYPHCTRLLRQRFRTGGNNIVEVFWEFDNKFLNDGHIVVLRAFRVIWRTITFNVIPISFMKHVTKILLCMMVLKLVNISQKIWIFQYFQKIKNVTEKFEDTKRVIRRRNQRRTYNTMGKRKMTKRTNNYIQKTLHRKHKI